MPLRIWVAVMPDTTVFRAWARSCELKPRRRRLVLVDPDPDRARRLHPVVVDVPGAGLGPQDLRDIERDRAHLVRVRSAHPVLQRPSDRRPELQRIDPSDNIRKLGGQRLLQLRLDALALLPAPW